MNKTAIIPDMKKLLRLFLLCVLMLAIPMQAAIAASRICCATGHSQHAASQQHEDQHHPDESHDATSAECCIAAAILNTVLPPVLPLLTSEKIDLIFSSYAGHISDCPDKPPRLHAPQ
ncbi:MAG: hypothetical protein WA071_05230 [Undibacterium umbellatum]